LKEAADERRLWDMELKSGLDPSEQSIDAAPSLLSAILRRRKRVVLATALVAALGTAAFAADQPKRYTATTSVAVQSPLGQSSANTPNMATEAQVGRSVAVAQLVQRELHLAVSPSKLLSDLAVNVPVDSNVLQFAYSDPSARNAQIRADAFAHAYLALRQTQLQSQVLQGQALASMTSLREQIQSLTAQQASLQAAARGSSGQAAATLDGRVDALTSQINALRSQLSALTGAAGAISAGSILGPAPLPGSPTQSDVVVDAIVGFIVGLLLGFGVAAARERLDDRLRNAADVRTALGAPVLGVIPRTRSADGGDVLGPLTIEAPGSRAADAFRRLRANVVAAATDANAKSILVTSSGSGDGQSGVALNLAGAFAAAGKRAVVVLLRQDPALNHRVEVNGDPGFADALAGTVSIRDALRSGRFENMWFCGHGRDGARPHPAEAATDGAAIATVPVGRCADLLGSDRAKDVIAELGATADYVLVDAPPVQVDADAYVLAGVCDGVLAVATLGATRRSQVEQASEEFNRARATLLGSVLIDPGQLETLSIAHDSPLTAAFPSGDEPPAPSAPALQTGRKWQGWSRAAAPTRTTTAADTDGRED
jgi:Mrp family chromosome partitioning ATPase/capsular polysaccharide biosynthesis protein